ncbi:MAG: isoprenylcysteine carboxylmethyltransferase family protein [Gemmatimonadaceae bacterium]
MSEVERLPDPGIRVPPPLLFAIPWLAGYGLHQVKPIPIVTRNAAPEFEVFGWALIGIWLVLMLWAFISFRRAHTTLLPYKPATAFVTTGPYRLSRNPMYVSLGALYLGMACLLNTLWLVVLFPLAVWLLKHLVIEREEVYLASAFGQQYRDYCARVRRWI